LDLDIMMGRKETIVKNLTKGVAFLFKKNKVNLYTGKARLTGCGSVIMDCDEPVEITAKNIILATGSEPATIPGIEFNHAEIGDSTDALSFKTVPKRLLVIGAGVIGLELGAVWNRLGSQVTIVEYQNRILPEMDVEISKAAYRLFKRQKIKFYLNAHVLKAQIKEGTCEIDIEGMNSLKAEKILVATGRRPFTRGLELADAGVELTKQGRIKVDDNWATTAPGIYAIGDVIGGAMLAHKASEEGVACVENLAGGASQINYSAIPAVVYTDPEIASVGQTEEQLKRNEIPYNKGTFSFKGNGRAMAHGRNDGLVKVLADADDGKILGVHIIGPWASELIAQATTAIHANMSVKEFSSVCTAHPSLSEAVKEATLAVSQGAIHA